MNNNKNNAEANLIVKQMYDHDAFSQWLGVEVVYVEPGACKLRMVVRDEMTNGFAIGHGGITYSFADSALAFASNGHGQKAVSIETSISHLEPTKSGDVLTATATEIKKSNRVGWYRVEITNQDDVIVATFTGTVYRTNKDW